MYLSIKLEHRIVWWNKSKPGGKGKRQLENKQCENSNGNSLSKMSTTSLYIYIKCCTKSAYKDTTD